MLSQCDSRNLSLALTEYVVDGEVCLYAFEG